jgi:serine protease Do
MKECRVKELFMTRLFKSVAGFVAAVAGGVAVFAVLQSTSFGRDTEALPRFNIQDAPISREAGRGSSYAPIIKKAAPSVVNIYTTRTVHMRPMQNPFFNDPMFHHFFGPDSDQRNGRSMTHKEQSLGSGVIVSSDGYILTANHVVDGADEVKVALATGGNEFTAKVIGTDAPTDVAVLKITAKDLPVITIADSDKLEVGDVVLAIGSPFALNQTVTLGIVSALGRSALGISDYENFIQTDAAINPGNSGGALVDTEGRLIGINTAIFSRSGGSQGVGFAVPVNLARSVMERLIKFGKVTRGYLGVSLQQEITPDLAREFNLPDTDGAMVAGIQQNTPAAKAGLENGDVIRLVDGRKIKDSQQLRLLISQTAPGTKVTLTVLRSEPGKKTAEQSIAITLGTLPGEMAERGSRVRPNGQNSSDQDALDGVEVDDLNANARRQFNIPAHIHGALVTVVDEDSKAAAAQLREGDVIQEINRHPVNNADDAVELSKNAKGDRILLRVWSQGRSRFVVVDNSPEK